MTSRDDEQVEDVVRALSLAMLELLDARAAGATICPSEAARRVAGHDEGTWRALMPLAREAARRLVDAGEVVVTQRGVIVDVSRARGPIRVRRTR